MPVRMKAALTAPLFDAHASLTMAPKQPCALPGFQVWRSQNEHSLIAADSNNSVIKLNGNVLHRPSAAQESFCISTDVSIHQC